MADPNKELLNFVLTGSRTSLNELYLTRLNEAANMERQLCDLIVKLADTRADALIAGFLRDHGEELIAGRTIDLSPSDALTRRHAREPHKAIPGSKAPRRGTHSA